MSEPVTLDQLIAFLREEEKRSYDMALADERSVALDFYNGKPFGDEEKGRSQVVTRDVAEVIDYMTVSTLRTMVSGDRVVEFECDDKAVAEQATLAVSREFFQGQRGYQFLHDWIKAGLLEKASIAKCCVEPQPGVRREAVMQPEEMAAHADAGAQFIAAAPLDEGDPLGAHHVAWIEPQPVRFRDYVTPNESVSFAQDATDLDDDCVYVGFHHWRTLSQLAQLGFDTAGLGDNASLTPEMYNLAQARDDGANQNRYVYNRIGPNRRVIHHEEYVRFDLDGDGIAEQLLVHRVQNTILKRKDGSPAIEVIDEQPGVSWCPFPMQHRIVGQSLADKVMDIQRTSSVLMRQALDNLYQSNAPRWTISESSLGDSTIDDLLTIRAGGLIRYAGAVAPVPVALPFSAQASFDALEIMRGDRESRTGITRMNQGLDADALNKMLCIETPVPMASGGHKRLAEIADGDWLIGSDGGPVRVLKAHKIHDPERAYRIRFSSGEEIDAGGEHLWTVQTDNDKRYHKFQTVDTDRMFEMMQGSGRIYIPRVQRPLTGAEQALPLDPYLLGTWLGDGSLHAPRITTADEETVEYVDAWATEYGGLTLDKHQNSGLAKSYYVKGLYPILRSMKLLKRGDAEKDAGVIGKHIPEEYLRASYRQRLELLRGLMDTDGCHHSNALCVFVQKGGALLDGFVRLVESLGGWPSVRPASADGCYQVTFTLADCPFRLTRKAENWRPAKANATTQVVKSIRRIAIKPMRCLTVDADDGLFCVGRRFTLTHNTATGTALMQASGQQIEEYVARNFAEAFARLMLKKYRLMRQFGQPFQMVIDDQPVMVDPRQWPETMQVQVRVGLGTGRKEQRIAYRQFLLQATQPIMQAGLPVISAENLYNNLKGLVADMALGAERELLTDPASLPPQPPPPDPETVKAQAQAGAQVQVHQAKVQSDAALQQQKAQLDAVSEQRKLEHDFAIAEVKARADVEREQARAQADIEIARERNAHEFALELSRQAHEMQLAEQKLQEARLSKPRPGGALDA